jgi:hypothetical protein
MEEEEEDGGSRRSNVENDELYISPSLVYASCRKMADI